MSHQPLHGVEVYEDAVIRLLRTGIVKRSIDSSKPAFGDPAPSMRCAETSDVIEALVTHAGQRFPSEGAFFEVLHSRDGGGFGIPPAWDKVLAERALRAVMLPRSTPPDPLPTEAIPRLGVYVYALLDPLRNEIFYVGKGRGNRVYQHVWAAIEQGPIKTEPGAVVGADDPRPVREAKTSRIRDIYNKGVGVEHWIVRHAILTEDSADGVAYAVEQGLIDGLGLGRVDLTNIQGGRTATEHRMLRVEELAMQYAAEPAPPLPHPCALIKVNSLSNIGQLTEHEVHDAARQWWHAGVDMRAIPDLPIFAFADDVVRAAWRVESWEQGEDPKLWRFSGTRDAGLESQYVGRHLRDVRRSRSDGKWRQHGWHPYP